VKEANTMRKKRADLYAFGAHERKCPVCGAKFRIYCEPNEWGFWYNDSDSQLESKLTLFCSDGCSRAYAKQKLEDEMRAVRNLRAYAAYRMYTFDGLTTGEIKERLGFGKGTALVSMINQLLVNHGSAVEALDREYTEASA
jgi:hypothetical protein